MDGLLINLRTGDWLTRDRMRMWTLAVLTASFGGLAFLWATSDGLNDYQGRPLFLMRMGPKLPIIGETTAREAAFLFHARHFANVCFWQILLQKSAPPSQCATIESNGCAA